MGVCTTTTHLWVRTVVEKSTTPIEPTFFEYKNAEEEVHIEPY